MVDHFIRHYNAELGRNLQGVSPDGMQAMLDYDWPGNIRQLEHAVEHILIHCKQPVADVDDIPAEIVQSRPLVAMPGGESEDQEQQSVLDALEKTAWNKAKAARLLGIDRKTLYRKIEKFPNC